jgi:hypothetical protein
MKASPGRVGWADAQAAAAESRRRKLASNFIDLQTIGYEGIS